MKDRLKQLQQINPMSVVDYKKAAQRNVPADGRKLYKQFKSTTPVVKDVGDLFRERTGNDPDPDALLLPYVISSEARDRDGDIIQLPGWETKDWKEAPAVLFAHDHRQPLAKGIDVWEKDNLLHSLAEFPAPEVYPFGNMMYRMIKGGYTPASASVGFLPMEYEFDDSEEAKAGDYFFPMIFTRQELLEWSVVSVGSNRDAGLNHDVLHQAKSAGIDLAPLNDYVSELLDSGRKFCGVDIPPKQLESIYALTRDPDVISIPRVDYENLTRQIEALSGRVGEIEGKVSPESGRRDTSGDTPDVTGVGTPEQEDASSDESVGLDVEEARAAINTEVKSAFSTLRRDLLGRLD